MEKIKILYIDDEPNNLVSFRAYFRPNKNYEIYTCSSGQEGLKIMESIEIPIVIADQKMPHMTGVEFLEELNTGNKEVIKIIVTAHKELDTIIDAYNKKLIFEYHEKPWDWNDINDSIERAILEYQRK